MLRAISVLLTLLPLACSDVTPLDTGMDGVADASDSGADSDAPADAADDLGDDVQVPSGAVFQNMFAARACNSAPGSHLRDSYCGGAAGGAPENFDEAAFGRLYADLDDTQLYPSEGSGPYKRLAVPMCEDGTNDLDDDGDCASDGKEPIRCTDGTRPLGWIRASDPASQHANDWIVRVQGGDNSCGTHDGATNCFAFDPTHFSSVTSRAARSIDGIFESESNVPPLHEWGVLFLDKCVGDRNLGDRRVDNYHYLRSVMGAISNAPLEDHLDQTEVGYGPVYFHGKRIIKAAVSALARQNALVAGSRLLVNTQSNGSHGLYQYIDEIAAYVDTTVGADVDVKAIPSSYVRSSLFTEAVMQGGSWGDLPLGSSIDAPQSDRAGLEGYNTTFKEYGPKYLFTESTLDRAAHGTVMVDTPFIPTGLEAQRFADWGADPDATCLESEPRWVCLEAMHVIAGGYLETPTFFAIQLADKAVRGAHHLFSGSGSTNWHGVVFHPDDFAPRVMTMVERIDDLGQGHGAFVTHTDDHSGLSTPYKVRRSIGGVLLVQALYDWALAAPAAGSFCVSLPSSVPNVPWFHANDTDSYVDTGHDTRFLCPGAQF